MRVIKLRNGEKGFTLIELLVVMVVIGILASLLFPVLNSARRRAWDVASRELCYQTAAAWNAVLAEYRRFPPSALLTDSAIGGGGTVVVGGGGSDLELRMTTKACSLLNWWTPRSPNPVVDTNAYRDWLTANGNGSFNSTGYGVSKWPKRDGVVVNDLYLERTPLQRDWGLVAPWIEYRLANQRPSGLSGADADVAQLKKDIESAMVRVVLDVDGDGKVRVPNEVAAILGLSEEDREVGKTVIAWVYSGPKKDRVITSWR